MGRSWIPTAASWQPSCCLCCHLHLESCCRWIFLQMFSRGLLWSSSSSAADSSSCLLTLNYHFFSLSVCSSQFHFLVCWFSAHLTRQFVSITLSFIVPVVEASVTCTVHNCSCCIDRECATVKSVLPVELKNNWERQTKLLEIVHFMLIIAI